MRCLGLIELKNQNFESYWERYIFKRRIFFFFFAFKLVVDLVFNASLYLSSRRAGHFFFLGGGGEGKLSGEKTCI